MTKDRTIKREIPKNLEQVFTVTKYELLKYLRSKRLVGTILIIALILSLIYILPPALGNPYAGEREDALQVNPKPELLPFYTEFQSYANFSGGSLVEGTLIITVNGSELPISEWLLLEEFSWILFEDNLTLSSVVATYEFTTDTTSFGLNFLSFAEILIIICVTFFGADALVSEFQNRTAYLLFPNPIKKEVMFVGKFLASFIAGVAMISIYYFVTIILSFVTLGEVAKHYPISFGFAMLFLLAALALAYFISSLLKGSTGAIVLTFFLLLMILPIIEGVGAASGVKMGPLLTFAGHSMIYSLSLDDYPADTVIEMPGAGFTFHQFYPELGLSAIILAIYAIVFAAISIFLFKRRELTM